MQQPNCVTVFAPSKLRSIHAAWNMNRCMACILFALASLPFEHRANAQLLRCSPFTQAELPPPVARQDGGARARFDEINSAIKTQPHRVLFFGDSPTEYFDLGVWDQHISPRGVLNAGVGGDRTDHLRWRLEHGHLDGPPPQGIVVLIGTNELGHEWPPISLRRVSARTC